MDKKRQKSAHCVKKTALENLVGRKFDRTRAEKIVVNIGTMEDKVKRSPSCVGWTN